MELGLGAMTWRSKPEDRGALNSVERHGFVGLATDLPSSRYSNALAHGDLSLQVSIPTWRYGMMHDGERMLRSPTLVEGKQEQQDDGERPNESLRRTIDDVRSGRIETTVYPSAKEYLEHLKTVLDE